MLNYVDELEKENYSYVTDLRTFERQTEGKLVYNCQVD